VQEILETINRIPGVRGSVIIGTDGLVAAADLSGGEAPDALGATASRVLRSAAESLGRLDAGELERLVLHGTAGSLVVQPAGGAVLLTLLRRDANMGLALVEIRDGAHAIEARLRTP
jgi:predicted regulator of Ras-like GTPase activity (Roadblock/LC7/MglB family)